jgi:hypothetical protein
MKKIMLFAFALLGATASLYAQSFSPDDLARRTIERRGVDAAIWGMPIVSVDAMRRGYFGVGAKYNDIAYFSKPADWRFQLTTPNASSLYVYFNFNLKDGPVVVDMPAAVGAGLFGSILDAWQVPLTDVGPEGEDRGTGGKYLLLPPGFSGDIKAGYFPIKSATYNGYAALRAIPKTRSDEDTAKALALVKQLRVYPFAQVTNPPPQQYIDIAGKPFEGIAAMDDTFFDSLAKMVNEETVQTRDLVAMGQLRSIGIEKGKDFKPDAATRTLLKKAAAEAQAGFMETNTRLAPYWPNAKWGSTPALAPGVKTGFTFETETGLDVDARGATYFIACAIPKKLGAATFYLFGAVDAAGVRFDGAKSYRLRVPPNVPVRQFWAVTVYDLASAAFIREAPKVEVNSYQDLQKNADGSVDVFFGPKSPPGKDSNWIYTAPNKQWITAFRFYGPEQAVHDKTWSMGDIEEVK